MSNIGLGEINRKHGRIIELLPVWNISRCEFPVKATSTPQILGLTSTLSSDTIAFNFINIVKVYLK
jgi:hypothetical protein